MCIEKTNVTTAYKLSNHKIQTRFPLSYTHIHTWDFTYLEIDSARWLLPYPPVSQQLFNRSEHAEIATGAYYSSMKDWQRSLPIKL